MNAPGVKFQFVDLARPPVARLRTDICGFAVYAERGPLGRAVKLTGWRQFLDTFGPPLGFSYGGHSIRLYFENGGAACHVVRVTDPDAARTATLSLGAGITLSVAFSGITKPDTLDPGPLDAPSADSAPNPGSWGNRLAAVVLKGGLGTADTPGGQPPDGASLRINTIAGFHVGSWVQLVQNGVPHGTLVQIASIDTALNELVWTEPVTGGALNFNEPIRVETVEFSLLITLDGQEIGRYDNLSLDPAHPRYLPQILTAEASFLAGDVTTGAVDLADVANWPSPSLAQPFSGGADGLASAGKTEFLEAFEILARVDEVSVLACPDLVLDAVDESPEPAPPLSGDLCHIPEALPSGLIKGRVVEAGTNDPVRGVQITSPDATTRNTVTDADGTFTLDGLPIGQVMLYLGKTRFIAREILVQTSEIAPLIPLDFELALRSLPVALTEDEVFEVQQAMLLQGEQGLYRVALLDPPPSKLRIEDVQSWRSRFDSSFGALYWPWLRVVPEGATDVLDLPPSGAIAGLLARLDLAEGPQRSPANRTLRAVQALSEIVDDPQHALLNEQGINVIRPRPGRGVAPQGARTLSSDAEWRYLGVRRLMLMIAEAIEEGHQWAVFEPNTQILRDAIKHSLTAFLNALWRRGAFAGATPEAAFAVKCDVENNPPEVIDAGQLVAQIAVAPVRPFEFIKLRLGRTDRLRVQVNG